MSLATNAGARLDNDWCTRHATLNFSNEGSISCGRSPKIRRDDKMLRTIMRNIKNV